MFKYGAIALSVLLSACAGFDQTASLVSEKGAAASDRVLTTAEWTICNAATIGAVRRRYGASAEMADAYQRLCASNNNAIIKAK